MPRSSCLWLVVSGALDPDSIRYLRLRNNLRTFLLQWTPLVIRIILVLALGALILTWMDALKNPYDASRLADTPTVLLLTVGTIMIALGIAGRIAAFVMIFPLSFTILDVGLEPVLAITLMADLAILLLGTGALSLWEPEKTLFGRRWGAE